MYVDSLQLTHYRNYESLALEFSPKTNVLIGENAQGKTNLLEALYVLALTRSHRTSNDRELIYFGQEFTKISGRVITKTSQTPLSLSLSSKGKKARVNHLEQAKLSQYIGHLNVVLFAPEDLNLVKGPPAVRRRFIDMEFGQMSAAYLYHMTQYKTILKQRNHYLKQLQRHQAKDLIYLDVLSDQLATFGAEVIFARLDFLTKMQTWAQKIHTQITDQKEQLTFDYQTQVDTTVIQQGVKTIYEALKQAYQEQASKEIDKGTTLLGPHRDDVVFLINQKNVQSFGSQGQQRTVALSVKLAEIDLMHMQTGEYPVLLLDDVLSELDDMRQTHLLKTFQNKVQTFLTTTSLESVQTQLIETPKIFKVSQGQITT